MNAGVLQKLLGRVKRCGASDLGSNRVESRNRCVPRDFPEALVAPPAGTRTTDFAVLLVAAIRHALNTNDLFFPGQGNCCTTPCAAGPSAASTRIACAYNRRDDPRFRTNNLASYQELAGFLAEVERRAFKQAMFAIRDEDAALDVVQDAMLKLTEKYAGKPVTELPMLFQRILQNTIHDHFRRQKVRTTWTTLLSAFGQKDDKDDDFDLLESMPAKSDSIGMAEPALQYEQAQVVALVEQALTRLPARQREAFLLRYWEELDVAEAAAAMGCSEGSVKTHCSRAVHALAEMLRAKGISL